MTPARVASVLPTVADVRPPRAPETIVESTPETVTLEELERVEHLALDARRLLRDDYRSLGGPGPVQLAALELWRKSYAWYRWAEQLGIPRQFWRATIEEGAPAITDTAALRAVRAFCPDVHGAALGLLGPTGTGKTFAAIAALRAHMRRKAGEFYHVPGLVRALMDFETRDATMGHACEVHLLVLDDLGASYTDRSGMADSLIEELLWTREAHRRSTVFTSNLRRAALDERLGDRIADRLRAWATIAELPGKSLRGRKP